MNLQTGDASDLTVGSFTGSMSGNLGSTTLNISSIPEPGTTAMLCLVLSMGIIRRRRA